MDKTEFEVYNLPVLPLRGLVVFPKTLLHFDVGRKKSKNAIHSSMSENQMVILVAQKNPSVGEPKPSDLYSVGVIAKIVQVLKQPDDITRVIVEGKYRAKITEYFENNQFMYAQAVTLDRIPDMQTSREIALIRKAKTLFEEYAELTPNLSPDVMFKVGVCNNGGELADYIAGNMLPNYDDKQLVLETIDVCERLETLIEIMTQELYILEIEEQINEKARERIDKNQREYFLREQKSVIEAELGEADSPSSEADDYIQKIKALKLPEKSEETLVKECKKMSRMPFGSQEVSVIRTYLDTVLDLPWNISTEDNPNFTNVKSKLESQHYGLDKVKRRIMEQLAVRKLNPDHKGNIICLVGPPGVGKTSIAHSVADALGRKSARVALGGVHDEAEIRGHRRTYIGSMPGRIINAVKTAGSNNPVIVLDEIDKLGSDYKGDPSSALLEVLDSEQNSRFVDHYIDIPFDLSKVFFITTANDAATIPAPLYDRMEIIEIGSYTREEKLNIAKKHLIPKQLKENGLTVKNIRFMKTGILAIIDRYTREAGVRRLEQRISDIMRRTAFEILSGNNEPVRITDKNIIEYLNTPKYSDDKVSVNDEIGLVNGLAWTAVGGTMLPIEVACMPGDGKIVLTGSLGNVMQESARAAITCIRSHADVLGISSNFYKTTDIHIHAPEGAIPKDGPSAGITMATAIYSALSERPVRHEIAMTGEITLRGKILPIGGLKEKSMAAYKSGIKSVYIPKKNMPDLDDVDTVVKEHIEFIPVETFTEVLLTATKEAPKAKRENNVIIPNDVTVKHSTVRQ